MSVFYIMLISSLILPVMMIIFGLWMKNRPPRFRSAFGYKSSRAAASEESWLFAQQLCGKLWLYAGVATLILTGAAFTLMYGMDEDALGMWGAVIMSVQTVVMVMTIIPVEVALRRTFDKYGVRKEDR